jgi:hypothetical protein
MGTSQIRISPFAAPNIIDLLKRKRDEEVMSERLPNGVPAIAAASQTPIRIADAPIQSTNNLSSPPNITATNAQMPTPDQIQTAPIINKSLFDARTAGAPVAPSINAAPVISRNPLADPMLADKYMATAKPYDEPNNAPDLTASRPRLTQAVDPVQADIENLASLAPRSALIYGQDAQGNQRTHGRKGDCR